MLFMRIFGGLLNLKWLGILWIIGGFVFVLYNRFLCFVGFWKNNFLLLLVFLVLFFNVLYCCEILFGKFGILDDKIGFVLLFGVMILLKGLDGKIIDGIVFGMFVWYGRLVKL